jgi:hypothetical protein
VHPVARTKHEARARPASGWLRDREATPRRLQRSGKRPEGDQLTLAVIRSSRGPLIGSHVNDAWILIQSSDSPVDPTMDLKCGCLAEYTGNGRNHETVFDWSRCGGHRESGYVELKFAGDEMTSGEKQTA